MISPHTDKPGRYIEVDAFFVGGLGTTLPPHGSVTFRPSRTASGPLIKALLFSAWQKVFTVRPVMASVSIYGTGTLGEQVPYGPLCGIGGILLFDSQGRFFTDPRCERFDLIFRPSMG